MGKRASSPTQSDLHRRLSVFLYTPTLIISAIMTLLAFPIPGLGADANPPDSAPIFGPNDLQHGFSEYDTMPTIPSDSPMDNTPENSPKSQENLDQPPEGLFFTIEFAEGFEEEEGLRRGHTIIPVRPTDVFHPDTRAVFLVFSVFKHYTPYQVFGRMYPENVEELDSNQILEEDAIYLATEDEGGYLQFFPPSGRWHSGTYRVEIYVGFEINPVNQMGTMRFSVTNDPKAALTP